MSTRVLAAALLAAGTFSCSARRDPDRPATVLVATDAGGSPISEQPAPPEPADPVMVAALDNTCRAAWQNYGYVLRERTSTVDTLLEHLARKRAALGPLLAEARAARTAAGTPDPSDADAHDAAAIHTLLGAQDRLEAAMDRLVAAASALRPADVNLNLFELALRGATRRVRDGLMFYRSAAREFMTERAKLEDQGADVSHYAPRPLLPAAATP
jgi:hypothetical protein